MTAWRLVADVGGTNVRLARTVKGSGAIDLVRRYEVRAFGSFREAVETYLAETGLAASPLTDVGIGAAGPVDGSRVTLTNAPWAIDATDLAHLVAPDRVRIVNDLQTVALLLPWLHGRDVEMLRGDLKAMPALPTPRIAVNVGTGFGAAVAQPIVSSHGAPPVWHAFATEAGHMTAGAAALSAGPGERIASIEDALSGAGVVALASALSGCENAFAAARDVFADTAPLDVREHMAARLGSALGVATRNLVLAHAAWGGAFLVGSVARALLESGETARTAFVAGFETDPSGPMAARLSTVPLALITRDHPELAGLSYLPITA